MANDIYRKKSGRPTYIESKMIKDIEEKRSKNPSAYNYQTATTREELERIHTNFLADDGEIISETKDKPSTNNSSDIADISDPHNESAPKIRDYVKAESFSRDGDDYKDKVESDFSEPTNFDEAFNLPDDDDIDDEPKKSNNAKNDNNNSTSNTKVGGKKKEPVNPDFDDMSPSAQKKETKEFAKIVVDVGCKIIEQGIIWYTTKDFTDAKLIQMSLDGEIDLDLLISLDNRQQATVRDFFNQMEVSVKEGAKFDDEYKESLTRSLYKVMLEKGIAPTPMQSLLANLGKGLFEKAGLVIQTKIQANSILNQLKEMKINSGDYNTRHATDTNEEPLTAEGVEELFKEESNSEVAPTNDEGEE